MTDGEDELTPKDIFLSSLPPEARAAASGVLSSLVDVVTQGAMNWGFEVIKHLVVLNGAGLAAIVALAQAFGSTPRVHVLAVQGAHIFVAGLAVALVAMVSVYFTGLVFVRRMVRNWMQVASNKQPLSVLDLTCGQRTMIAANWSLAAASMALFLYGATRIAAIT